MSNMSYCRFNNTEIDLTDCIDALENGEIESKSEFQSMKNMVELCERFLDLADSEPAEFVEEDEEDEEDED